ncbi:MAG: CehA/McbA family metallohydrolase [Planctomycetales bacterium]
MIRISSTFFFAGLLLLTFGTALVPNRLCAADAPPPLPVVYNVELQPFVAATDRLLESLDFVGAPLSKADEQAVRELLKQTDAETVSQGIQKILDPYCLMMVTINPESRVSVAGGPAKKELTEQGWRNFLVKIQNDAGINPPLRVESPNAEPLHKRSTGSPAPKVTIPPSEVPQRFLDVQLFNRQPQTPNLSGLNLEYRILQVYTRDVGKREAKIGFNVGQGTQDIGFRNMVPILFQCVPAVTVGLGIRDFDGKPTTAALLIHDKYGRVYPNPARRLAPDFFFHKQIYRADGEHVMLPPGEYTIEASRGPEYLAQTIQLTVPSNVTTHRADLQLKRWIHVADRHWYSGDHHVHAAGCSHYESPSEGVAPADMMRHILGEDLNVGCVLSWGPCWYVQKQYFEGKTSALSVPNYLMRYDVEVSGFPSSHAGHLCLLRLKEDDYPGTTEIEQWPSWTLPVLDWTKKQGGVAGYSHSGWGLELPDVDDAGKRVPIRKAKAASKLPDYEMPPFNGIGANEYIVTVAHDVCDFISAVDTPAIWELNVWYHTLNCGFRCKISGETDFPCIYGEKVGLGRIYVKMDPKKPLDFDGWADGLKDGRSYCGDGLSHILDFEVNGVKLGEAGAGGKMSQVKLDQAGKVKAKFDVAAYLQPRVTEETEKIRTARLDAKPYWNLERCRMGQSRKVPVELILNGYPVATKEIEADGHMETVEFDVDIPQSSWLAVRILPSVHTNPIWVEVGDKPVRASRRSAEWCVKAVETCWNAKAKKIRDTEKEVAKAAYDKAKAIYQQILTETTTD